MIELFNVQEGSIYVSEKMRQENPNAEYFTAELREKDFAKVVDGWEEGELSRVVMTFRKIDIHTKSGTPAKYVAGVHNGKTVLFEGGQIGIEDTLLGIAVGVAKTVRDRAETK